VPVVPDASSAPDELAALRAANARLREVIEAKDEMLAARDAQIAVLARRVESLTERVAELERRLGRDSSNSSRPPSSDSPHAKKPRDRSLRERGKRRPGKQPGEPGSTMSLVDHPDEIIDCPPAACCGCGADLAVGHHIPIYRATLLLCQLAGIAVSTGWMAGIRGRAGLLAHYSNRPDLCDDLGRA
jgi:uncharacterized coiled-coil protein SlyX